MKISERDAAVLLTEDGREVLKRAALNVADSIFLAVRVEDTDDIGIWIRVSREDGDHLLLVRWEYVLSMDFPIGQPKTLGLR
jgi:hypothetical protein